MDFLPILNQFGDGGVISFLLLLVLLILYPRLYIWQMIFKIETQLKEIEGYVKAAKGSVLHAIARKPEAKMRKEVDNFMDFFVVEPVALDPYGIIRKIEHVIDESERRVDVFVDDIAAKAPRDQKSNIKYGLFGAISLNQIFKVIRHYLITIKKTGNLQLALLLQMVMPMIMKIAKAEVKGTNAFVNQIPLGDSIGPAVAASFKTKAGKVIAKDVVVSEEKIAGRRVVIMKAKGPAAALGKLGDAVEQLAKRKRINHIITIDAAGKLEGEKTGDIAEGVGVTMGGSGVEKSKIENVATRYGIPLDGVAIKMAPEEAFVHLKKRVYDSLPRAREVVERVVKSSPKKSKVLVIGVGNTCGIGNAAKDLKGLDERLKPIWKQQAKEEAEEKRKAKGLFKGFASTQTGPRFRARLGFIERLFTRRILGLAVPV